MLRATRCMAGIPRPPNPSSRRSSYGGVRGASKSHRTTALGRRMGARVTELGGMNEQYRSRCLGARVLPVPARQRPLPRRQARPEEAMDHLLGTGSGVFEVSCRDLTRVQCVPPPGPCYVRAGPTAVNSCVMYCEGGPAKSSEKEAIAAWNAG